MIGSAEGGVSRALILPGEEQSPRNRNNIFVPGQHRTNAHMTS